MTNHSRGFIGPLLLLIVAALFVGGGAYYFHKPNQTSGYVFTPITTQAPTTIASPISTTSVAVKYGKVVETQPSITITSPAPGTLWEEGQVHRITWTFEGTENQNPSITALVKMPDGSNCFTPNIFGRTGLLRDGSYSIDVPYAGHCELGSFDVDYNVLNQNVKTGTTTNQSKTVQIELMINPEEFVDSKEHAITDSVPIKLVTPPLPKCQNTKGVCVNYALFIGGTGNYMSLTGMGFSTSSTVSIIRDGRPTTTLEQIQDRSPRQNGTIMFVSLPASLCDTSTFDCGTPFFKVQAVTDNSVSNTVPVYTEGDSKG